MTDNDKHKLSDDELDDYLAGKDSVSKAYRELDDVTSPPHLDEKILARARESVAKPASTRSDVFIRPYATAATVFLCLAISFLFLNNPDAPGPEELRTQNAPISSDIQISLEEQTPVAESAEPSRFAAANRQEADDNTADNDAAVGAAQDENLVRLLDLGETRRLNEVVESQQRTVVSVSQLTQEAARLLYRENRESWLEEIARLRESGNTQQADEEAQLFLESYPETDLEAALQALDTP